MKVKILYPTKNSVVSSIRRKTQDARRKTQDARRKTQDARRLYLIITLIHIYCKSFVNFIVSQVSLLAFMILFVVITRATPETSIRLWRVIQFVRIATPHFTKGGQTPVRLAMTKKILSLRGFVKTEVIQNICCAFLITMWLQPIVLTIQREAHKGFAIGVPLGKPLVIRNWIASLPFAMTEKIKIAYAVRHMAMTITKIFNSISFRDYSLLFIKKIH